MILEGDELDRTLCGNEPLDRFGPETRHPFVALRLASLTPRLAARLRTLPCPVIGIGPGGSPLAAACDVRLDDASDLPGIASTVTAAPIASTVLVQHLRATQALAPSDALTVESFAYATVQRGPEFLRWQTMAPATPSAVCSAMPLRISRDADVLHLWLDDPERRNMIGGRMRDALVEAFDLALIDQSIKRVELRANGRCFSIGGDTAEFGTVSDPATGHWIRSLRLPATRAVLLAPRLHVCIDGAAIGAGLEIAAFAGRLTATSRSWFQLPELRYGLIPGAGGTVSLSRRIGRQRLAYLALTMKRLSAEQALAWGMIDALV